MTRDPWKAEKSAAWATQVDRAFGALTHLCALATLSVLVLILVFVGREAAPVFDSDVGFQRLLATTLWQPVSAEPTYGVWALLAGTLKIALIAVCFAVPLGVGAAVYVSEYAPYWVRSTVKPLIELLSGIPSVIIGFFALLFLATALQWLTGSITRLNAFNAGIALGIGILPIVFTLSEDSLNTVSRPLREASYALGATRWQTTWGVTLPAASVGISAGILLGAARAIGETMIVLMASGNAAILSWHLFDSARTVSATIAGELAETVVGSPHYAALFFLGAMLFVVTFLVNAVAGVLMERMRRKLALR